MLTTQAQRDASRRWREKHPGRAKASYERTKAKKLLRYQTDPEFRAKTRAQFKASYARNPQAFIASHERWRQHPANRIADSLRTKLRLAYQRGLTSSIEDLLGCTLAQFRTHIAGQFSDGMTRSNHGQAWEFDHIKPCAMFDLTNPDHQKACFHFTNLRPLTKAANKSKNATFSDRTAGPAQPHAPAHHLADGSLESGYSIGPETTPTGNSPTPEYSSGECSQKQQQAHSPQPL